MYNKAIKYVIENGKIVDAKPLDIYTYITGFALCVGVLGFSIMHAKMMKF